jgi:preprotein translocase subunit SecE
LQTFANEEEGMTMADELEQPSEDLVEQAKADKAAKRGLFGRVSLFFKQVLLELKKVTKPTASELRNYTGVVLAFVSIVMVIIFALDWAFIQAVKFAFTPTP